MKKILRLFTIALTATAALTSCIQDEAPNAECDILTVELPGDALATAKITNNSVEMRVKNDIDISKLAPVFELTEGATITPENGSEQDFKSAKNNTILYMVESEDRQWKKEYTVSILRETPSVYSFSPCELDMSTNQYSIFREIDQDGYPTMTWASGNPGYVMCGVAPQMASQQYGDAYIDHIYEFFPTSAVFPEGTLISTNANNTHYFSDSGEYAKPEYIRLVTRSTGFFGNALGMPIAAGNIFQGVFETSIATKNPLGATKFGELYFRRPVSLNGSYRYKAGETFTDENNNVIQGKQDIFSLYALFYETDANVEYLDGTIHELEFKHPNLVAIAMLPDPHESEGWVDFEVPFTFEDGKTIDSERLENGNYKIGIVISSSADGDFFRGAVGSTLDVKNLEIKYETDEAE